MAKEPKAAVKGEGESYGEVVQRLDEVVRRLEGGELSLEDSLKAFEDGIGLVRKGEELLSRAEKRIEQLLSEDGHTAPARAVDEWRCRRAGAGEGSGEGRRPRPSRRRRTTRTFRSSSRVRQQMGSALPHRPKVIIVDDDRETRELIALALEQEGFAVAQAANGLKLIANLHIDRPELILMDVNMSWIDGFELCRAVRQNEDFRDIPVVFVSARTAPPT